MRKTISTILLAAAALAAPISAQAAVRITEFMYQGSGDTKREFVELTNISDSAVNIAGWSYNDSNPNDPVSFGNFFGSLAANESIILTEMTAVDFRSYWGLSASVRIFSIGGSSNLGGEDTINIYSSATQNGSTLVDSLAYSGATPGVSRNRPANAMGSVTNGQFIESALGDAYGSNYAPRTAPDLANPGRFPFTPAAAVPEPATWAMMIGGFAMIGASARRRSGSKLVRAS